MTTQSDSDPSAALAALTIAPAPASFYDASFPQDGGEGTEGGEIRARVNYFEIKMLSVAHVHIYSISFQQVAGRDVKNAALKKQLIVKLMTEGKMAELAGSLATDYNATLVALTDELPRELTTQRHLQNADGSFTTFTVDLKRTHTLLRQELETSWEGNGQTNISPWLTALNILARHQAMLNTVSAGADRMFDKNSLGSLGLGLHARSGFFNSVRPVLGKVVLNVHRVCAAFIDVQPLHLYVEKQLAGFRAGLSSSELRGWDSRFKATASGLRVQLLYTPLSKTNTKPSKILTKADPNSRVRRIGGFGSSAATQMFDHDTYGRISVKDYFEKHVLTEPLRHANLLVCDLGSRGRPIYVPSELLFIEPHHVFPGKLPEAAMSRMVNYAQRKPVENVGLIENAFLSKGMFEIGKSSHIKINSPSMIKTPARILTVPGLRYAGTTKQSTPDPLRLKEGGWNLMNKKFRVSGQMKALGVITVGQTTVKPNIYTTDLPKGLSKYGVAVNKGARFPSPTTSTADLSNALAQLRQLGADKYVLVILPSTSADDYANVKWWSDTQAGIHTVCVLSKNIPSLEKDSFIANLALKFNVKSNGRNHYLAADQLIKAIHKDGPTMVVGADVTHPGPAAVRHCPSIAAVVASTDEEAVHFPGTLSLQRSRQEIIEDLSTMIAGRLRLWYKNTRNANKLPANILIYRDGVSESQFASVKDVELVKILEGCRLIGQECNKPGYQPKITLIVCGKRHHTRFYPIQGDLKPKATYIDSNDNFKPGLVVDSKAIRNPYHFDFYLQSHNALKGTARPCHYFVIENGMNLSPDHLQRITFNLCWTFARSLTPISYAAPAYYADLLAERGRCYLAPLLNPMHPARPTVEDLLSGGNFGGRSTMEEKDRWALHKVQRGYSKFPNSPHWVNVPQQKVPMRDEIKDSMFYI